CATRLACSPASCAAVGAFVMATVRFFFRLCFTGSVASASEGTTRTKAPSSAMIRRRIERLTLTQVADQFQDGERPPIRRDEVRAVAATGARGKELARVRHADLGRVGPGGLELVLERLRHDDPRHLVVQAQGEPVARQREDAGEHRDLPAAEERAEAVEGVE